MLSVFKKDYHLVGQPIFWRCGFCFVSVWGYSFSFFCTPSLCFHFYLSPGTCDIMGGLPTEQPASALTLAGLQQTRGSEPVSKPKKKICCACPDTKKIRDDCIVEHGEAACEKWIEAHRRCLRAEGFKVWNLAKDCRFDKLKMKKFWYPNCLHQDFT